MLVDTICKLMLVRCEREWPDNVNGWTTPRLSLRPTDQPTNQPTDHHIYNIYLKSLSVEYLAHRVCIRVCQNRACKVKHLVAGQREWMGDTSTQPATNRPTHHYNVHNKPFGTLLGIWLRSILAQLRISRS